MFGKEFECKECNRAFRVNEGEKKEPKCPSCDSSKVTPRKDRPLPSWMLEVQRGSG